jgi:hypothetical protein
MLGGACAGFDCYGTEGGGAALGEDDSVDACSIGYAEQSAEVLRVFYAVEGEKQAAGACVCGGGVGREQVFDGEEFLRADESNYALVGGGFRHHRQLVAGFLADADAGLAKGGDEALESEIFAFAGYQHMVKATPAGFEGFFDRVHAVQNFHEG